MALDNNIYNEKNDIWGLPQIYKSVSFYPIKIIDTREQESFYKIFYYPKRNIADKKILKMSYLKFLIFVVGTSLNVDMEEMVIDFIQLITKENNVSLEYGSIPEINGDSLDKMRIVLKINNVSFEESDFEIIREIILLQNGSSLEYVESYNQELEEKLSFVNRKFSDVTMEDEVLIFCSILHKTIDEVRDYTLYQFKKHFERLMIIYNFGLYSPLEISGQIKSKHGGEIMKHYLSHIELKGRYDEILIQKETFQEDSDLFK